MGKLTTMFHLPKKERERTNKEKIQLSTMFHLPKKKREIKNIETNKTNENETESLNHEKCKVVRILNTCKKSIHKLIDLKINVLNIQKKEYSH